MVSEWVDIIVIGVREKGISRVTIFYRVRDIVAVLKWIGLD